MKPRHKALALAHAAGAPAEADAADLSAPVAASGAAAVVAPPLHFAAGASTSAAAGAALTAKRERTAVKASRGGAAANRRGSTRPQRAPGAAAPRPTQAAAPTDEPSMEVKKKYKGVYWCVARSPRQCIASAELACAC